MGCVACPLRRIYVISHIYTSFIVLAYVVKKAWCIKIRRGLNHIKQTKKLKFNPLTFLKVKSNINVNVSENSVPDAISLQICSAGFFLLLILSKYIRFIYIGKKEIF